MTEGARSFWQINIGHVLSTVTVIASVGYMYGQLTGRLETDHTQISTLTQLTTQLSTTVAGMQVANAASDQDRIDLHRTIESDFARRLSKLEDRLVSPNANSNPNERNSP